MNVLGREWTILRRIHLTCRETCFMCKLVGSVGGGGAVANGQSAFIFGFLAELKSFSSEHFFILSVSVCLLWATCTVIWMFVVGTFVATSLLYSPLAGDEDFD